MDFLLNGADPLRPLGADAVAAIRRRFRLAVAFAIAAAFCSAWVMNALGVSGMHTFVLLLVAGTVILLWGDGVGDVLQGFTPASDRRVELMLSMARQYSDLNELAAEWLASEHPLRLAQVQHIERTATRRNIEAVRRWMPST